MLTDVSAGRIQLHLGCWREATLSSLHRGPFHRAAHNVAARSLEPENKRQESAVQTAVQTFIIWCHSGTHHICHILFGRSNSQSPSETRGEGIP